MANLKGSKTEANLKTAFAGESQARNKYSYFSTKAKEDGYDQAADFFKEASKNEREHAKIWFKLLNGISDTPSNLKAAAAGENYEYTEMYAEFSKTAKAEGFDDISNLFSQVAAIEKEHEARFLKLLENANNSVAKDVSPVWRCKNCGNIVRAKNAPDKCPVCGEADIAWSGAKAYVQVKE